MDKNKKEPIALRQPQNYQLCFNCGFPNRQSDANCMYCSTNLVEDNGLLSWLRQTYYVLRWRWQLKQKRENLQKKSPFAFWKSVGYFCLGLILSFSGVYIFTMSISENSFSNAIIAILLLIYGFYTIKTFLSRR